jgi:predicted ATPase
MSEAGESWFTGRAAEVEALSAVLARAASGAGGMVWLAGEAGAGKTALVEQVVADAGPRCWAARAAGAGGCPPFESLAGLFAAPGRGANPLAKLLRLGGSATFRDLRDAVAAGLERATRDGPAVLFLDDAQSADPTTLERLPEVLPLLESRPVALVVAFRDDEVGADHPLRRARAQLGRERSVASLALGPLGDGEARALIEKALGAPPSPGLANELLVRSGGLPLFLLDLCRALRDGDHLVPTAAGLALAGAARVPLPESVRDLASLQMAGLSGPAREALEAAAVAGPEFDIGFLLRLGAGEEAVDQLIGARVLAERGGRARFRHPLVREVALEEVPWSRRRRLHGQVADLMAKSGAPAQQVAEHLLAAGREADACRALLESAERACGDHAYGEAAEHFSRALAVWPEGEREDERLGYLERMARCAQSGGCLRESARAWREIAGSPQLDRDPARRASAFGSLALVHDLMGAEGLAAEARDAAIATFERAGMAEAAAGEALAQAESEVLLLRLAAGQRSAERALDFARKAKRSDLESRATSAVGLALAMQGRRTAARRKIEAALQLALEHGHKDAAAVAYQRMAYVYSYVGDYRGQCDAFGTAIGFCNREGLDHEKVTCLGCMSYALFRLGEWKKSAEVCRGIIDSHPPGEPGRLLAEGVLGVLCAARGQVRQARKLLLPVDEKARALGLAPLELVTRAALAWTDEQSGTRPAPPSDTASSSPSGAAPRTPATSSPG